ncbi:TetR family transcriptional regulator [Paraphotobacterium marinum]|uniref:TetR family transcriptional regulator n=1 Tax=Paraphotobacterium marinum TaxID=1755811 RepID=A0A220VFX2_9GAMM|nr:TetR/AcrR family transcriptional regulator [Paraphotobacterium marinum]ASK79265.1 TetR family transcriptional regulator [Paraphotobacterium marinum]
MAQASKREQIITTALKLFYKNGFNATGIEEIRKTANVSKKTLYNHFKSKDELILAVLLRQDEQFRHNFIRAVERFGTTGREQLVAIFDALNEWFNDKDFTGCIFVNAVAELKYEYGPYHTACSEHKRLMHSYIKSLAKKSCAQKPDKLSAQLNLLIEGATVQAHVCGDKQAALKAKEIAMILIESNINKNLL